MSVKSGSGMDRLLAIMSALRATGTGCNWDIAQTHKSLAPYAIEEAYEVVDAIERGSAAELRDELGDLLLQVVFHSQVASEAGTFAFADVVEGVSEKMTRRHPHIFAPEGDEHGAGPRSSGDWEEIKATERAAKGLEGHRTLDGVPLALPGLTRALKLQSKAARVGFDWDDAKLVLDKIREETDEITQALEQTGALRDQAVGEEIGDLLFAIANLARHLGLDPESCVRATNTKFERRFAFIEDRLSEKGSSPDRANLDDMEVLWNEAKRTGL